MSSIRVRLVGILAIMALFGPGLVGSGAAQDGTPAATPADLDYSVLNGKRLAFVLWGFDGYQQAQGNWFQDLAEAQGAEVTLIDGRVDPQVQVEAMDDLIASDIDGIVFQPVEPAAAVTPVRAAQEAGIPLVLAGAEPDPATGVVAPFVEFNDYEVTFQAGVNAQLAEYLGSPMRAALVSFVVGVLVLLPLVAVFERGLPAAERVSAAPWWAWLGGALGAFYVAGSITSAPKLGAVTLIGVILAGQALASLVVDHFGMVGFDEHPATLGRVAGLLLIALGVLFVRLF